MPESKAQVRYARAVLAGKAKKGGMPKDVAQEIVGKMHGKKMSALPERVKRARRVR